MYFKCNYCYLQTTLCHGKTELGKGCGGRGQHRGCRGVLCRQAEEALPDSRRRADRLHPRAGQTRKAPTSHEPGGSGGRCPALPRPGPVTGRGEARQEVGSGSWVKAPGQERAPCAGSGRGLRQALVSLNGFGKQALPRERRGPARGRSAARGIPSRRLPGRASAPGGAASPSAPLDRLGSGAGAASLACGGAPGAGNRGTGSAGSLPAGDGPGGRTQEREEAAAPAGSGSAAGGADPALRESPTPSAQGLPSSSAAVPRAAPAVLTTRPAVEQSGNCVYSGQKGNKQNTKKFNELSVSHKRLPQQASSFQDDGSVTYKI